MKESDKDARVVKVNTKTNPFVLYGISSNNLRDWNKTYQMLDISLFKAHQNSRFWVFISILLLAFIPWLNLSQTKHHFVLLLPHPFITFGFLYFFSLDIVTIVNFESNLLYILWAS